MHEPDWMAGGTTPTPAQLTASFGRLRKAYPVDEREAGRLDELRRLVARYGCLPWSHQQALEELPSAEAIALLEDKLERGGAYAAGEFRYEAETLSAVRRAGYTDSAWIRQASEIKLINLAGLGNGNISTEPGRLIDWLKQLVTLPGGDLSRGGLGTTLYLLPFHPREFGSAYIPRSGGVSAQLADPAIQELLGLDAAGQVRLFLALAQLAGHPLIYDVLPQTGRFSAEALANPSLVRWFDIPTAIAESEQRPNGEVSARMMARGEQDAIAARVWAIVCEIVCDGHGRAEASLTEADIVPKQDEITTRLIREGLWSAPGGAWCSSGPPVFDTLPADGSAPVFRHFDKTGRDVTSEANLDCLSPYYFAFWDTRELNEPVISAWIEHLRDLRSAYNFDGFRFDHVDHIVDDVSVDDGFPISYRVPAAALRWANEALRADLPHFASLAEYMLWDGLLAEYHQEMGFDVERQLELPTDDN